MTENINDYSKGSIKHHIVRLAVPITAAQIASVLYNLVDRIFIGRIAECGTDSLTGLGVCLPAITIITAFANLVSMGGAPLFSIERGRSDEEKAQKIMSSSFSLLVLFAIALTALMLLFHKPVLMMLGASEATYPYAAAYFRIYMIGNIFVMISLGMNPFINAQGFARTGMLTVFIGAGLNIILDPILIYGAGMGVQGAAAATLISQAVSAAWVLRFLTGPKALIRLTLKSMQLQPETVKKILSLGLSGFMISFTNSAVLVVCNFQLSAFGGDLYIGIMTILNSVREFLQLPAFGVQNGAQPVMSYNYGAEKPARVKESIRFVTVVVAVIMTLEWIIIMVFPEMLFRIFTDDPAILKTGPECMHIYYFGYFFMAFQISGQATFTSLGRAKNAIFFSVFRKIILVVPLTLLLPHIPYLGVTGVFLAEPISNAVGSLACFFTMYFIVYRRLDRDKQIKKNI